MRLFPPFPPTADEENVSRNVIVVKRSTIPGAGRGVFAARDIPANVNLGYYRGMMLPNHNLSMAEGSRYILGPITHAGETFSVCGKDHGNWTALINSPYNTDHKPNLIFYDDGTVYSKRNIKAGEELFVGYGASYWNTYGKKSGAATEKGKTRKAGRGGPSKVVRKRGATAKA
jgi:uncharacterized protein